MPYRRLTHSSEPSAPAVIVAFPVRAGKHQTHHVVLRRASSPQIHATDVEIDRLVYELYGLTEEEIRIVEGATQG